jgi:hypothetical protein
MRRAFFFLAVTIIAASAAPLAQAQDRYGSSPASDSDQPAPLPMLTWPGKAAAPAPRRADDRYAAPPTPAPTSLYDAPPPRWRSAEAAPSQPAAAPAPAVGPQGSGEGLPPHFYSVARQYGVQPDPVQLSPQFLASTPQADMAEPPPLPPPHAAGPQSANMSAAAATNQVRQAQEAAADADTAALGN